ncbi:glycine--tRNA ligase [Candidatus Kaiserbacteria bacterium RIFCSPHIGHO2_01_FULL_54_36]|uniref:glycine--tRNA ligase n=1 Tax=Candidatus Kaiserbacteria bacterium RIFCSPHIGHO2_01_FULL_54_36 TaxID=1798482 RepID=A0A1F6CLW7_9BACT|nr:MAG: glycine--tRNA ligase [Candidatus Kaiserbacteria bacterium RIFCSPHIGHO2_01_FULL_54_36]OGG75811.1 MAG: glycine--tRNA ligase [Candidatus Kaiserbacteria bacterium RIFCSPLOWO2_01_FULL_54_22]
MTDASMEKIVSLAKRRGFIYPGSEIYGGLSGTWDYGPLGVELKNNVKQLWWRMFVQERDDMCGLDAAILMNGKVWEASGHVSGFSDPLVECKKCKRRFRADQVEDKCPECTGAFGEVRQFNMMFKTQVGATDDASSVSYLRPETAGGIFVNFKNIVDSFHPKLPFGIAQIGKAFRNEIAPRDFVFRVREFEQMEIEYFVRPTEWEDAFEEWRKNVHAFNEAVGIPSSAVHELEVPDGERAHYSKRTIDFEFDFPFGRKELYGLAYRTDFDLSAHSQSSGVDLKVIDKEGEAPITPHVVEPSFGVDRTVLAILASVYTEDELGGEPRTFLKFNKAVAPIKAAVFPLLKNKPELVAKAREIYNMLKKEVPQIMWDDNGNIGKRYRRQDEIGTPYCITVDFDTLGDPSKNSGQENLELKDTVTIRDRDTGEQERVSIDSLVSRII